MGCDELHSGAPGQSRSCPDARAESSTLNEQLRNALQQEFRALERNLAEPSLAEALRLLESPHFASVTDAHVRAVGEYRPIEILGERFFERAWSRSKEAAAMLGFARLLGADFVRGDLCRLWRSARAAEPTPDLVGPA